MVLISAGVGITPIAAILEDVAARTPQRPVLLAHADHSSEHHALRQAVDTSAARLTSVTRYTWYEAPGDPAPVADGEQVRSGLMDLTGLPIPADAQVFMCGPLPFMRGIRRTLIERGLDPTNIAYEIFGPDLWSAEPELIAPVLI